MTSYFAHIGPGDLIDNVIVADQEFIDSGLVGDPETWEPTGYDGEPVLRKGHGMVDRKNYAGIGYTFDRGRGMFISPEPDGGTHILDEQSGRWKPKPGNGNGPPEQAASKGK